MPWVGFEPKIPVLEWAETVHTLDRAVAVIGTLWFSSRYEHKHQVSLKSLQ
jgi:hypothetical protein